MTATARVRCCANTLRRGGWAGRPDAASTRMPERDRQGTLNRTEPMLTTEQLEIQTLAREFAEGEIRPHAPRWDEARELNEEVFGKLGDLGFLGMRVPERYGGLGLDWTTYLLVLEELSRGDAAVALSVSVHCGPVTELVLAS